VFGSLINRMILAELLKVFLLALTALTGLFLLAGLIQEAAQRGLSPGQVLLAIPLLIPNTLPYTIPATTLFATCVVYGRMAHDNEVLVLKAAGVNTLRLLKPAILLGVATSAVTAFLYYETIPRTQQLMRTAFMKDAEEIIYGVLKRDRQLRNPSLPYFMFVKEVQGRRLVDVVFKRRIKAEDAPGVKSKDRYGGYDLVARAREATLHVDMDNALINIDMENCSVYGGDTSGYGTHPRFQVPLPESIFGKDPKQRPSALTWDELDTRRAELVEERAEAHRKANESLDLIRDTLESSPLLRDRKLDHFHRVNKVNEVERMIRQIDVEKQFRPALAVGCLCFVLIGCPVGIWASRADYLSTFVVCFLPTIFIYYPLVLCGTNLAKDGKVPVPVGVWAADVLLAMGALVLIWRLLRR
jgi:lipopolysaccharide export system permease protein